VTEPTPPAARQVRLEPSGRTFTVTPGETILEAATRAGVGLPYGCRNGACGACKGTLRAGEVAYGEHQERAITAAEKSAGKALTCCTRPTTDLVLEIRELAGLKDLTVRTLPARVEKIERPAEDVAVLYLKLPASERLQFLAGQYVDILMKGGVRRSYSMANAPHDDAHIQLHVRRTPGGTFSRFVFEEMKERAIVRFEGPLGSFYLREDSDKPMILVAGGTGFAPGPGDAWPGRTGLVHQAVLDDFSSLAGYQVYACGAPAMTDVAKATFVAERGLPEDEFYCDAFTYAAPAPAAAP
jgi:CDP-4-dehydro-6-deoxyglucose reductase